MVSRELVLDTTYILPAFGIEVDVDSTERIGATLGVLKEQGVTLHISDLSPLEGFVKAFRIAEKLGDEPGKKGAKIGFLAVTKDPLLLKVNHSDEEILNAAYEIRITHTDPFDCFIFATAKVFSKTLLTEDRSAAHFLGRKNVLTWNDLRKSLGM